MGWWGGGLCDYCVSPSPFGLDFGTLDFGTSDLGLTISVLDYFFLTIPSVYVPMVIIVIEKTRIHLLKQGIFLHPIPITHTDTWVCEKKL